MVTILLPSNEDTCLYKLRLKIAPASYYQEAIQFSIDQKDLNEFFEPKYKQLFFIFKTQLLHFFLI